MESTDPTRIAEYYAALCRRDASYLGSFVVGVTSTGICCLPTCRARKPLPQNVRYFSGLATALGAGFRPCKICRPEALAGGLPAEVRAAIKLVGADPTQRLRDHDLWARGIDAVLLRRAFRRHYGITFQAFARQHRLARAVRLVAAGSSQTDAAYDAGYESLSGFAEALGRHFPGQLSRERFARTAFLRQLPSPLGPLTAAATDAGVCLLGWSERGDTAAKLAALAERRGAAPLYGPHPHLDRLGDQLADYFAGERRAFTVPLDLPDASAFRQNVWAALAEVPYGTTVGYGELARRIGRPTASRAVAAANGANPVAVLLPCHRVVGARGRLTGYAGGVARKRYLLQMETGAGGLFAASDTEGEIAEIVAEDRFHQRGLSASRPMQKAARERSIGGGSQGSMP